MTLENLSFQQIEILLALLSAAAGIAHVLAPDHWLPISIVSWQRGWGGFKVTGFSILAYSLHVALGAGIYFAISPLTEDMDSQHLFILALVLMVGATALRSFRFDRMKEIFGTGPRNTWSLLVALSLLGPAESLIPILVKSLQLGMGYLLPFICYFLGTLVAATSAILIGRRAWNSPAWIPRGIRWANRKTSAVPFALAAILGLALLIQMG